MSGRVCVFNVWATCVGLSCVCVRACVRVCVFVCIREREKAKERERGRDRERKDDDEHDDDAVGGCQGVLEYRHRSVT